jgi:hypothetical protein
MRYSLLIAVLFPMAASAAQSSTHFAFSTPVIDVHANEQQQGNMLARQRKGKVGIQQHIVKEGEKATHLADEDQVFWNRFLQMEEMSVPPPTNPPPVKPPVAAPVAPPVEAPVAPPVEAPAAPPSPCPVVVSTAKLSNGIIYLCC